MMEWHGCVDTWCVISHEISVFQITYLFTCIEYGGGLIVHQDLRASSLNALRRCGEKDITIMEENVERMMGITLCDKRPRTAVHSCRKEREMQAWECIREDYNGLDVWIRGCIALYHSDDVMTAKTN